MEKQDNQKQEYRAFTIKDLALVYMAIQEQKAIPKRRMLQERLFRPKIASGTPPASFYNPRKVYAGKNKTNSGAW